MVQQFNCIVECSRIAHTFLNDREQLLNVEVRRREHWLPSIHPVDIAAQSIDFSVVAQIPEWMRKLPGWKRVRRKALMHQTQRASCVRIEKLVIELADLIGQEQAFIDDRAR